MDYNQIDFNRSRARPAFTSGFGQMPGFDDLSTIGGVDYSSMGASQGGAQKGWLGIDGLGANMNTMKLGMGGLQTLAGLWASIQGLKMAKKQYALTKATTNANLANQTQSYNTGIADRARSRGVMEGQSTAQVEDYIARNSLAKRTV